MTMISSRRRWRISYFNDDDIIYEYNSRPTSTWPPHVSWTAAGWNASEPCNHTRARTATLSPTASWRLARPGKWSDPRRNTCLRTPSATRCTSGSSCAGVVENGVKFGLSRPTDETPTLGRPVVVVATLVISVFGRFLKKNDSKHVRRENNINSGYTDTAKACCRQYYCYDWCGRV